MKAISIEPEKIKELIKKTPEVVNNAICMEEPAELITALPHKTPSIVDKLTALIKGTSKAIRSAETEMDLYKHSLILDGLTEEMADVCIVIALLQEMYCISDSVLQMEIDHKMKRNLQR